MENYMTEYRFTCKSDVIDGKKFKYQIKNIV